MRLTTSRYPKFNLSFFTLFEPIAIVENLPKNQNLFPKTTNYLLKTMQRYGLFRKQQWIANGFWKKMHSS